MAEGGVLVWFALDDGPMPQKWPARALLPFIDQMRDRLLLMVALPAEEFDLPVGTLAQLYPAP